MIRLTHATREALTGVLPLVLWRSDVHRPFPNHDVFLRHFLLSLSDWQGLDFLGNGGSISLGRERDVGKGFRDRFEASEAEPSDSTGPNIPPYGVS
jgi:hypothetical protein